MKKLSPELEARIDEIYSWMFEGDQKKVAKKARVDEPFVSRVLTKKVFPNKKVLDAAIEVMDENKVRFGCASNMKVA
jgi:hypothetical protein